MVIQFLDFIYLCSLPFGLGKTIILNRDTKISLEDLHLHWEQSEGFIVKSRIFRFHLN